jgi:class 3 adenylate cyclase
MVQYTGVLFADLRGFTERVDRADPQEASRLLRRFYRCAEDVLFPDAVIDKLIGDEVMALYLPDLKPWMTRDEVPERMLEHARDFAPQRRMRDRLRAVCRDGNRDRCWRGVRRQHRTARVV